MTGTVSIYTVSSSATATAECAGHVVVSGSYGGEYNAFHAAKWGIRGVVLNDAGVGKGGAGIKGLSYLDRIGLAAATADAMSCHIADAEHMLEHGRISHVNAAAQAIGCSVGQTVRQCADRMQVSPVVSAPASRDSRRQAVCDARRSGRAQGALPRRSALARAGRRGTDRRDRLACRHVPWPAGRCRRPGRQGHLLQRRRRGARRSRNRTTGRSRLARHSSRDRVGEKCADRRRQGDLPRWDHLACKRHGPCSRCVRGASNCRVRGAASRRLSWRTFDLNQLRAATRACVAKA